MADCVGTIKTFQDKSASVLPCGGEGRLATTSDMLSSGPSMQAWQNRDFPIVVSKSEYQALMSPPLSLGKEIYRVTAQQFTPSSRTR
jgi:hypothetical protein